MNNNKNQKQTDQIKNIQNKIGKKKLTSFG